jgi:hypothetical protein
MSPLGSSEVAAAGDLSELLLAAGAGESGDECERDEEEEEVEGGAGGESCEEAGTLSVGSTAVAPAPATWMITGMITGASLVSNVLALGPAPGTTVDGPDFFAFLFVSIVMFPKRSLSLSVDLNYSFKSVDENSRSRRSRKFRIRRGGTKLASRRGISQFLLRFL